jgi:predicted acylesterase/phospholipase RssA
MNNNNNNPEAVVLGGGGIKSIAMMGGLAYLKDMGFLDTAKMYVGTSAGAVVATSLALGMHPRDLFERHVEKHVYMPSIDISGLDTSFGLDDGRGLLAWLCSFVPPEMTFEELYQKTHKTLVVVVANLNTKQAEYLSHETAPKMEIVHALRMSCSVPLYFSAVSHQGMLYVDGGVVDNFPLEYTLSKTTRHVLGMCFASCPKKMGLKWTLEGFVGAVLEASVSRAVLSNRALVVELEAGSTTNPLNFNIPCDSRRKMYLHGMEQTRTFMKKIV